MSRKHFEAIAAALLANKPSQRDIEMCSGEYNQWKSDVRAMANVCCQFNGYFDRSRFYTACGYES